MRENEPSHASVDELADELGQRWDARPAPGKRGEALRTWIETDCQPVTRDVEAVTQQSRILDDAHGQHDSRRAGREREADVVRAFQTTGQLDRDRDPCGDLGNRFEIPRLPISGALEIHE